MRPIDLFDSAARQYATRVALRQGGEELTFSDLRERTLKVASALACLCAGRDAVPIGVFSRNDYRAVVCTLAIMRAGAAVVPLHDKNSAEHNVSYLERIQPACVFYHSCEAKPVDGMKSRLPSVKWVCLDRETGGDPSLDSFAWGAGDYVDTWADAFGNPERPVYIRQTSGTTGTPKIIVNDVASFHVTQMVHTHQLRCDGYRPVCLLAAPWSHAAGVHAFAMLTLGATLVCMDEFDAAQVLRHIEQHRVTHIWLPASALYLLLNRASLGETDHSSLRSIVLGASAVSPQKLAEAVRIFGPVVSVNYSQIEGGFITWLEAGVVAAAVAGDHADRLRSSGVSQHAAAIAIVDENDGVLPAGEVGEIVVRGRSVKPYIVRPYARDLEEMSKAHRCGWHHTGDLGFMDDDGFLYVVGRTKDTVIAGGFKVSTAEVERIIMELPEVAECAVVGIPDTVRGEAVKAIVVVRDGHRLSTRDVIERCRSRLGRGHMPSSIEQWPQLPRTPVGKIDKRRIRESLAAVTNRLT